MPRKVTMYTAQWGDLPFEEVAKTMSEFGYDGLELKSTGDRPTDHFNVHAALDDPHYCSRKHEILENYGLGCWALSAHSYGQCILDDVDFRHRPMLPDYLWGDGNPEGVRARCVEEMKLTAHAAKKFGVSIVNGFTGSGIWQWFYSFPPVPQSKIDEGYQKLADLWIPILDVFQECGVKFALEVHPSEIAFDLYSAQRTLESLGSHPAFGFNFDPSHLVWQGVDPVEFLRMFPDRIFHVHMKDVLRTLNGRSGILSSHLPWGDRRRGWDFRSPGRGEVDFEEIIRELNVLGYDGPLSVEWEDCGMNRYHGAREAVEFVRSMDFEPSRVAFDAAFDTGKKA
ncbi:MAG: sugar phosphate isomerase/epimerase [Planctomycetia bacterium]|nr:sugar phosphate isomerase/epimerase [Planctomycetia bacterium]